MAEILKLRNFSSRLLNYNNTILRINNPVRRFSWNDFGDDGDNGQGNNNGFQKSSHYSKQYNNYSGYKNNNYQSSGYGGGW